MFLRCLGVTLRQRLQRLPAPAIDAGLAVAVAVVITISIRVSPQPGDSPDALAYALGLTIAALVLVRRRWPVAVLLVSAATVQVYYLLDYAGIRPAVPLAVALATAWGAGHLRWSLLVVAWFAGAPLLFRTLVDPEPLRLVLNDSIPDVVLFAAVLLLGEAVRNRRALDLERKKSERLLLNVLPASIAAPAQTDRGSDRRRVSRRHRAVRRHRGLHPAQPADRPGAGRAGPQRLVLLLRSARPASWPGEDQDGR
jgi:hypothetical protein